MPFLFRIRFVPGAKCFSDQTEILITLQSLVYGLAEAIDGGVQQRGMAADDQTCKSDLPSLDPVRAASSTRS